MAASSSMTATSSSRREVPSSSSSVHHDIFLSHSGAQKAFVKDLYRMLNPPYTPFFDISHHSLPPGENFPKRILEATKACKLAVVILSDEFLLSKWPMIELCDFVKGVPSVKILPVFYKLTPESLKHPSNVKKWHKAWKTHAKNDKRILVCDWVHALKHLISLNGPVFHPSNQGEGAYLEDIVSSIYEIFPIALKYEDTGIHGKDRLCEIILAKFRELDLKMLQPCNTHDLAPQKSGVCMLGMYGLPGSGKSTLSRCLRDHFFPCCHGWSFYLELPTNPTLDQLLNKSKELLRNLPGCHNMVNLTSNALDIHQVYHLFKISSLPGSTVFFVVDNISSQDSVDFVQHLLKLGFGVGSKVLLVARTLDVLQPLLRIHHKKSHYVCDSLSIPSINEAEAIQILLQSGGGGSCWVEAAEEDGFSLRDRQILEKVVRMSGFGPERHRRHTYLPFVLKIMGSQLRRYEFDIEKWGREIEGFWKKVEVCKEDAVRQLVQQSFESLPKKLQLLFLDIALFVLPYISHADSMSKGNYHLSMKKALGLLSIMHESSPERIEMEMHGLRQYCFVEIHNRGDVSVHDMYLEFAASTPESRMYYLSTGHVWRRSCNEGVEEPISMQELFSPLDQAKASELRAIILDLDEGEERLEFSASLASLRALVLRNFKSLTELGLAGLTSLVSLEIDNCPKLERVDVAIGNGPQGLKRLRWAKKKDETKELPLLGRSSIWMQAQSQLLPKMSTLLSLGKQPQKRMFGIDSLASQFSGLQTLTLENTGIKKLLDMSNCWPQLQELRVVEQHLEHFELRSLPKLKRFFFSDGGEGALLDLETDGEFSWSASSKGDKRAILGGKDMFVGCPNLEEIRMCSRSFVEGMGALIDASKLHTLWIRDFHCSSFPNLTTPLPQSVERLLITDGDVRNVNFAWRFGGLRKLELYFCPRLVEVTGLDHLPSLCKLKIECCQKLQILSGLDHLPSLCELKIRRCEKLQTLSGLSGLMSLESFTVGEDCPNLSVYLSELENLARLRTIRCDSAHSVGFFNVAKLVGLRCMEISAGCLADSERVYVGLERLKSLVRLRLTSSTSDGNRGCSLYLSVLLGVPKPCHLGSLESIKSLELCGLQNLAGLNGIEFLVTLESLSLINLKQLTSLQGMEGLVNLRRLSLAGCLQNEESLKGMEFHVTLESLSITDLKQLTGLQGLECLFNLQTLCLEGCVSVNELPSLRALVNMETLSIRDCVKLKAVEGCDAMTTLETAVFDGCRSLASLPLDFESLREMQMGSWRCQSLHIKGCKFATIDAMVAWALDENVPVLLREASLTALAWEFHTNLLEKRRERRALAVVLLARVGAYFLEQIFQSNEEPNCLAFGEWANLLERIFNAWYGYWEQKYFPRDDEMRRKLKEVTELLRGLAKVSKQQVLQQCRSNASFQLSVVECLAQLDEHDLRIPSERHFKIFERIAGYRAIILRANAGLDHFPEL